MRWILDTPGQIAIVALLATLGATACDNASLPPPPPTTPTPTPTPLGSLNVSLATSGTPEVAPNFFIAVGGRNLPIDMNGHLTVDSLAPGQYNVALGGLPQNCALEGSNGVAVIISGDSVSDAAFSVRCQLNKAWIIVSTTGTDIDARGYLLVTSSGKVLRVAPNDTVSFSTSASGRFGVALVNLAVNCETAPTNPDSVTIVTNARNEIALAVTCARMTDVTGSLHVVLHTNLEGSVRVVNGKRAQASGPTSSGEVTLSNLPPGTWQVGYAANSWGCTVNGISWYDNWWPLSVEIVAGATTELIMNVQCEVGGP